MSTVLVWKDRHRNEHKLEEMETSYLYHVVKCIWNNVIGRRCTYGDVIHWTFDPADYSFEYLFEIFAKGRELLVHRDDTTGMMETFIRYTQNKQAEYKALGLAEYMDSVLAASMTTIWKFTYNMDQENAALFHNICVLREEFRMLKAHADQLELAARVRPTKGDLQLKIDDLERTLRGSRNVRLHAELDQARGDLVEINKLISGAGPVALGQIESISGRYVTWF